VIGDRSPSRRIAAVAAALALTLGALAFALPALGADTIRVEAELSPREVAMGEDAQLTVTVTAEGVSLPPISLPAIEGVRVTRLGESRGLSFSMGQVTHSLSVAYRLHPVREGVVTIPSIRVSSGQTTSESAPLTLRVGGSRQAPRAGSSDLFARLTLDRTEAYWNQAILAHFTLYTRAQLAAAPIWESPDAPGFWTEALGTPTSSRVTVDGVDYMATEIRIAYFPTRTGRLEIGPGRVHVQAVRRTAAPDPWSMLAFPQTQVEELTLETGRGVVDVAPLPSGAPAGFRGAVGHYSMDVRVDRLEVRAGEPVTVVTNIQGEGNIASAGDPEVAASIPARTYPAGAATKLDRSGARLRGERRKETAFVPETPGAFSILPVRFAWFDPEGGQFRIQTSDSIPIRVLTPEGTDDSLRHSRTTRPIASLRARPGRRGPLDLEPTPASRAVAIVSMLAYAGVWAGVRIRARSERDPRRARIREIRALRRTLEGRRDAAPRSRPAGDAEVVLRAIGLRYGVDVLGRSAKEALEACGHAGAPDTDREEAAQILDILEREAFAPPAAQGPGATEGLEAALAMIRRFEEEIS